MSQQPAGQIADDWSACIGSADENVAQLVDRIRAAVAHKTEAGAYRDLRIAQAERHNLRNLRDDEQFLRFYLECLQEAAAVDINDFEIRERRRWGGRLLVAVKKTLWHLLKFYTYRLWSQQNQVNGLLVTALESMDEKYRRRIVALEQRLAALEHGSGKGDSACPRPDA